MSLLARGTTAGAEVAARLVSIVAVDGADESMLFAFAARLASHLPARLSSAILSSARERGLPHQPVDDGHDLSGAGAVAPVDGDRVVVGTIELFARLRLSIDNLGDWPHLLQRRGEQVLLISVNGRTVGLLGVLDTAASRQHHPHILEDDMRSSQAASDHFPTAASVSFAHAAAPPVVELATGEQFELTIAPVLKRLGETTVRMLAYNGSIPGPTLRVRQGSHVFVNVINHGDLDTTVHWHGLRLENRYDGTTDTQNPIPVGGAFTYRLTFPDPGVYWYHPHIREDYGQEMGLSGAIVVTPSDPAYWPPVHREITLMLDDLLVEDGQVAPFAIAHPTYTAMGRFGNVLLTNGEPHVSIDVHRDEVVRLYMVNVANTRVFNVGIQGARMKLVGADSGRCEHERFVEAVRIAPSERAVLDVRFDRPGPVTLEHRPPRRVYAVGTFTVDATMAVPALAPRFDSLRTNPEMTAERERIARYLDAAPDKTLAFVAEMDFGLPRIATGTVEYVCPMHPEVRSARADRCPKCGMKLVPADLVGHASGEPHHHAGDTSSHVAESMHHAEPPHEITPAADGIEWEDDMVDVNRKTTPSNMRWKLIDRDTGAEGHSIDWVFHVGDQVKIRLVNEMDSDHPMHHPFHIHGAGRFLILSRDGAAESNLAWKDTVLVPTGQTVDILLDVTHPGVWMAHCHIAEHHESGMMLRFRVAPAGGGHA